VTNIYSESRVNNNRYWSHIYKPVWWWRITNIGDDQGAVVKIIYFRNWAKRLTSLTLDLHRPSPWLFLLLFFGLRWYTNPFILGGWIHPVVEVVGGHVKFEVIIQTVLLVGVKTRQLSDVRQVRDLADSTFAVLVSLELRSRVGANPGIFRQT
jgi:hypothetical protein